MLNHFIQVQTDEEIQRVVRLADRVWREHYASIISLEQIDYMLKKFQSFDAIKEQILSGYRYYLIILNDQDCGYLAVQPRGKTLFLSKIYVLQEQRRQGLGARALSFVEQNALSEKLEKITLTVNKKNTGSICFYEKNGFCRKGPLLQDIGHGYVMDDYLMEKGIGLSAT